MAPVPIPQKFVTANVCNNVKNEAITRIEVVIYRALPLELVTPFPSSPCGFHHERNISPTRHSALDRRFYRKCSAKPTFP
jgi:hypothetical protein